VFEAECHEAISVLSGGIVIVNTVELEGLLATGEIVWVHGVHLLGEPIQLVVLGGIVAHLGVVFRPCVPHKIRNVGVFALVPSPRMLEPDVVPDFVHLCGNGSDPSLVVNGQPMVDVRIGEPTG